MLRSWLRTSACALLLAGGCLSATAGAVVAQVPTQVDPGVILREELPDPDYELLPGPVIREQAPQEAPEGAEAVTFDLTAVAVEGVTVFSEAKILALIDPLVGREVSVGELYGLANAITRLYAEADYALSFAVVPAQEVEGGRVRLQVVEGFIAEVRFSGQGPIRDSLSPLHQQRLEALGAQITGSRPLQLSALERALLLMNDLPGISARSVVQPAEDLPGASILLVEVERERLEGGLNLDNRVNSVFADLQGGLEGRINGLVDETDSLTLTYRRSLDESGLETFRGAYSRVLTASGLRLDLLASQGESSARSGPLSLLNFEGVDRLAAARLSYPVIRAREENLTVGLAFEWTRDETSVLGATLSRDDLRVVRLTADYQMLDAVLGGRPASTQLRFGLEQGLSGLGATADNPLLTGTINGFKLGQDASVLTSQPVYMTDAGLESPDGRYAITASGAAADNYVFAYETGTLTVGDPVDIPTGDGGANAISLLLEALKVCGSGVGPLDEVLCNPVFEQAPPPLVLGLVDPTGQAQ